MERARRAPYAYAAVQPARRYCRAVFRCVGVESAVAGTGNWELGTVSLYRDDGDPSTRWRSLGMTRAFCRLPPAARRLPPVARPRQCQSPVAL